MRQDKSSIRRDGMHSAHFEPWTTLSCGYGRGPSMRQLVLLMTCSAFVLGTTASAADKVLHTFTKARLSDQFFSEGATFGDFNQDGVGDVASGQAGKRIRARIQFRLEGSPQVSVSSIATVASIQADDGRRLFQADVCTGRTVQASVYGGARRDVPVGRDSASGYP